MRHLAALGRFALAGVFVLTQSTWAADSDSDWRKDDTIVAAIATDNTYIKKFIANAYAKYPTSGDWKKTKPGYSGFKKDLKDLIDKSDPDNEADPTFITLLGKLKTKYGVKMKLPKIDPADGQEAAVDKCAGKECADQAQPVSKKTKATVQSIKDAADGAAGPDGDEGKQGGGGRADPPPKPERVVVEPQAEPVIPTAPPPPEPAAPVVSAGASIQSNGGGGGLGGLFGGSGLGGSIMPFLGGALVGGILGSIMQRNGGGLGGLFGGGGQYGGAPYGYPQYNMMGMGRGPFLPGRYQAPGAGVGIGGFGATGGGYGSFGGGGYGAPAFAPYVTNGGVYGGGAVQSGGYFSGPTTFGGGGGGALCTNCVLPSLYPAGAYVPGVH